MRKPVQYSPLLIDDFIRIMRKKLDWLNGFYCGLASLTQESGHLQTWEEDVRKLLKRLEADNEA